jgi:hypothetical protein
MARGSQYLEQNGNLTPPSPREHGWQGNTIQKAVSQFTQVYGSFGMASWRGI